MVLACVPGALMLLLVGRWLLDVGVLIGVGPSLEQCRSPLDLGSGLVLVGGGSLLGLAVVVGAIGALRQRRWAPVRAPLVGLVVLLVPLLLALAVHETSKRRLEALSQVALARLTPRMTEAQARAVVLEANRRMAGPGASLDDDAQPMCLFGAEPMPLTSTGETVLRFTRKHYRLDASTLYVLTMRFTEAGLLEGSTYETYVDAEVGAVGRRLISAWP